MKWFIYGWNLGHETLFGPFADKETAMTRAKEMLHEDEWENVGIMEVPFEIVTL